jgi:hypothetical protein
MSRFEAGYCDHLHILMKAKDPKVASIESQVKFSLDVNGKHITNYYADFVVTDTLGKKSVHETKGFVTDVYTIKRRLFEAVNPSIPFYEIKY